MLIAHPLHSYESLRDRSRYIARTASPAGELRDIFRFGKSMSRIFTFALWSWDFELPIEQSRSYAISWC